MKEAFNLTITEIKQTAELLKVCTEHYVTSNRIECGQQFDRMHSDSSASYLHSERGAGTASCLERNGVGQQYWCKEFTYLRHKEKQRRHLLHTTNTLQPITLTDQLPRVLQYSAQCVDMRIQTSSFSDRTIKWFYTLSFSSLQPEFWKCWDIFYIWIKWKQRISNHTCQYFIHNRT